MIPLSWSMSISSEANQILNKVTLVLLPTKKNRLIVHNNGGSIHTSKFIPWKLVTYMGFSDVSKALEFECYLKTGSGRAFARKRLW